MIELKQREKFKRDRNSYLIYNLFSMHTLVYIPTKMMGTRESM